MAEFGVEMTLTSLPVFFAQASAPSWQIFSSSPTAPQESEIVSAAAGPATPSATMPATASLAGPIMRLASVFSRLHEGASAVRRQRTGRLPCLDDGVIALFSQATKSRANVHPELLIVAVRCFAHKAGSAVKGTDVTEGSEDGAPSTGPTGTSGSRCTWRPPATTWRRSAPGAAGCNRSRRRSCRPGLRACACCTCSAISGATPSPWPSAAPRWSALDFSPQAIRAARGLAEELGLADRARFVEADLYDAPSAIPSPARSTWFSSPGARSTGCRTSAAGPRSWLSSSSPAARCTWPKGTRPPGCSTTGAAGWRDAGLVRALFPIARRCVIDDPRTTPTPTRG